VTLQKLAFPVPIQDNQGGSEFRLSKGPLAAHT